ncbi:capsular polysaccharide export protein, LipB/KpsS family [Tabrizicola oligotrophica]|uniref:Capsular biosynthesis protein n=1 Tax=Tabrizicola oligotrophica TaxID=2710650 RepID=A0A6M0QUT8_9RHOB|nr:hypothetical protein [Tabrizicola oligotrophica]NEY90604.1 hypothetical protein [Tabrizicola oligotrophica]
MTPQLKSGRALVVHAGESWYDAIVAGRFDFFPKLADAIGLPAYVLRAERGASGRLLGMGRHLNVVIGPRLPVGPGIWHAHPGYLRGFWYLDPMGVNMHSSLVKARFDPAGVDPAKARWFWNGVTGWHLKRNLSKFPQEARQAGGLPPARCAVFLQEIERFSRPVHWIDSLTLLRTAARQGPTYVKLHPAQSPETTAAVRALADQMPQITLSTASIHDLAAAAEVVVTQNSAAGFEALLQKKPVITCARSDYHQATCEARDPQALARAIAEAPARMRGFGYDRFLYWFLGQNLLEPGKPEFAGRARAVMGQG